MKKKRNTTIIKSNSLIEGKYSFSLIEMKLLLSVISQIKIEDDNFSRYRVFILDFKEDIGMKGDIYNYLKNICKSLKSKDIEIETETGHLITSYVSDIQLYRKKGYIDLWISPKLKPYLLKLRKSFTIYDIRNVLSLSSTQSIRIYQLRKQWESIGTRTFQIDTLKDILGIDKNQYTRWSDFKKRVIDSSYNQLKKHSDIYFEYRTKRKGRFIDSITFIIKKQRQKRMFDTKEESEEDILKISYHQDLTEKVVNLQQDFDEGMSFKDFKKKPD